MTSRAVVYEAGVSQAMARFLDDPAGLSAAMDAIDRLADDPAPPDAVPYGPEIRRLRVGRYRVLYEITSAEIRVINVGRTA
ncbi:type II toxin-antitoxin system RelE/ParE family toxin [Actinocorallia sp. API 0066]|uniref:type II toxin-antitoxin system RelE family toxin n=1 Tax=Actinocorallia sp. API 0066 TaxID=2896846 RepID=UPI001E51FD63|nr:type II toxin-antitoxin system RelE/ParE family toxin [Actinocorallia sp. API 0066]MCD0447601.1 type II toxin-antitoxin system RelE/ParE family toxin [Actinocorallia sp. API 0066]